MYGNKPVSRVPPNKQLQRTVQTGSRRTACASFHYAHAVRFTRQRAAAELRRSASVLSGPVGQE
jgi:hypothetical protein